MKMAIIGFGGMGTWHYEQIRDRLKDYLHVKGIYDINIDPKQKAEKEGLYVYSSAEEILKDKEIELVLISTPNLFHCQYCIQMLEGGKNVVCEKPVVLNMEELKKVYAAQKRSGKFFTVHQNRRFDIDFQIIQNILSGNYIGKPYFIQSRLYGSKGIPGDWRACAEAGGGMLYDWSVHLLDQMLYLINSNVVSVYAELKKVRFRDVDDCNKILLQFENGINAEIVVDTWNYIKENRWSISAEDGTAVLYDWFGTEGKMMKANITKINWEEGVVETPNGRTRTLSPRPIEDLQELPMPIPRKPREWEDFYKNVVDCIENNAQPIVTQEQIWKVLQVVCACFESEQKKQVICLK